MSGQLRVTPVADVMTVLDIVAALQADELTHADALMHTMGHEACAFTAVGVVDSLLTLIGQERGMRAEDVTAHFRQWLELRQP